MEFITEIHRFQQFFKQYNIVIKKSISLTFCIEKDTVFVCHSYPQSSKDWIS